MCTKRFHSVLSSTGQWKPWYPLYRTMMHKFYASREEGHGIRMIEEIIYCTTDVEDIRSLYIDSPAMFVRVCNGHVLIFYLQYQEILRETRWLYESRWILCQYGCRLGGYSEDTNEAFTNFPRVSDVSVDSLNRVCNGLRISAVR